MSLPNCTKCGTPLVLSEGWVPSYNNPDNASGAQEAEPVCPKCETDFERENLSNYTPMSKHGGTFTIKTENEK